MQGLDINSIIFYLAAGAIPVLLAITLHEVAHGWVAYKLGDSTAKMLGRLTINPFKHIDPVGTIALPVGMLILSLATMGQPFALGWAKPIPVNARFLKHPRRDMALIALTGGACIKLSHGGLVGHLTRLIC
ncbi:site-2 protease family protein [Thiolinea disciformis]|uniref:site-2 protease family protein n=1 Tax=Thiolinea disciformis TaxID=125614 RepID=UPI0003A08E48|nr:site-2 protease family protein [Thiolinea disciformis]